MTLSTNIAITTPTDIHELRDWINVNLLNAPDALPAERNGPTEASNRGGQGLDAWLIINGSTDGKPLPNPHAEWIEDDEELRFFPECYAVIDFDTAYGFEADGMGCTELHASYIVRLATEYFEPRGLDFWWENEYTGEWHHGLDQDAMIEFLGSGDKAMGWFRLVALPTIEAHIKKEESP